MSISVILGVGLCFVLLSAWREHRRKELLVARACHEVRGPLTAAHLALHGAARRGDVTPAVVAALEAELRRATVALGDLTAGEGGSAERWEPVDLRDLLQVQVATWDDVARAHGAEVRLVGDTGASTLVRGDAVRLSQAISNVVANAIEHAGGTIEVAARRAGSRVRVEVSDGGPGLPAPVAELAAHPRGDRGHGLSIASTIVTAHEGRLAAAPSPRGARLAIDLPAADAFAERRPVHR